MQKQISRLWFLGPPVAILISIAVYYWKFPKVRDWVDERFPWVEENVGSRLSPIGQRPGTRPVRSARPAAAPVPEPQAVVPPPPPVPVVPTPVPRPTFLTADGRVELEKLAAQKAEWPKSVQLKKALQFPAVVNRKIVGKIDVPAGTEIRLADIQQGKLVLEYQGGGALAAPEDTNLAELLKR